MVFHVVLMQTFDEVEVAEIPNRNFNSKFLFVLTIVVPGKGPVL